MNLYDDDVRHPGPDDERAVELLRPLRAAPRGPVGVDVARAVARGQRRQTLTRVASVGLAVVLVLVGGWAFAGGLTPPPPQPGDSRPPSPSGPDPGPPGACEAAGLPLPPGFELESQVTGGDPSGRYLVGYASNGSAATPLIWDGTTYTEIALPDGESDRVLRDVNASGQAVGSSVAGDVHSAWVARGGQAVRLAGTAGKDALARSINGPGRIAGSIRDRPVVWPSPAAAPDYLPLPGADWTGDANGVDEDGTVVGTLTHGGSPAAYAWAADGTVSQLPAPMVNGRPVTSYGAYGISHGWIVGRIGEGGNLVRWPPGHRAPPEVFPDFDGSWSVITARGWTLQYNLQHAYVVVTDGRAVELSPPSGARRGGSPSTITALSDDGRVAGGSAILQAGGHGAFRWTCR